MVSVHDELNSVFTSRGLTCGSGVAPLDYLVGVLFRQSWLYVKRNQVVCVEIETWREGLLLQGKPLEDRDIMFIVRMAEFVGAANASSNVKYSKLADAPS